MIVRAERLLVIRRAASVEAPGKLCFPGGGIRLGETEQQTVVRELREELGVTIAPLRRLWESVTPWNVELSWWLSELPPDCVLQPNPEEVAAVYWLTAEELQTHPELLESNRQFLEALRQGEIHLQITGRPDSDNRA